MTKEEAIENIKLIRFHAAITNANSFKEALDMAIETLSQPSPPSNLDEAAEKAAIAEGLELNPAHDVVVRVFKAGAEWMAGQGYSKECTVGDMGITYNKIIPHIKDADMITLPDSFKQGDKVVVQIRKK